MKSILDRVRKGTPTPQRWMLYGVEGVGKSTFAANADSPIFICAEDGLGPTLDHVDRINVETLDEVNQTIADLTNGDHNYKTVVVDTADWLEAIIMQWVADKHGEREMFGPSSYGRGYKTMIDELRRLLANIDRLRHTKSMEVIILAHSIVKHFDDPRGESYDRYVLKGNDKFMAVFKEWCDALLFAAHEVYLKKDGGKEKAIQTDTRVIHTTRLPAYDAKNRHNLPLEIPLDYEVFKKTVEANLSGGTGSQAAEVAGFIVENFDGIEWDDDIKTKTIAALGGNINLDDLSKQPVAMLQRVKNYITNRMQEVE